MTPELLNANAIGNGILVFIGTYALLIVFAALFGILFRIIKEKIKAKIWVNAFSDEARDFMKRYIQEVENQRRINNQPQPQPQPSPNQ